MSDGASGSTENAVRGDALNGSAPAGTEPFRASPFGGLPPDPAAAISMRHLSKVYGNTIAVADLSLDIPAGSFYGIVGPNGAGKTTVLSMATGLLVPDRGSAWIYCRDMWTDGASAKQLLGVMPDGFRIFDRLTGPDYLVYVGMLCGLSPAVARARTEELLAALDLSGVGKKLIADYSAGMSKKIALGAALVRGPRVVVLDEPFEAVDPVSSANIRQILRAFVDGGGTVVLSSHVMTTVEKLCDHVAVINQGRIVAAGTTAQVAGGEDLETRFTQLVGGAQTTGGLSWLGN